MITFLQNTDIFSVDCAALVNPVDCTGVMGAGLAKEFRKRFPANYSWFRDLARLKKTHEGSLFRYKEHDLISGREYVIFNITTKHHWKEQSEYDYIQTGLVALRTELNWYRNIDVALPKLGCGLGQLDWKMIRATIIDELAQCTNTIFVCE